MRPLVVYDDSAHVPVDVSSATGVARFGDMLRRRERLSRTVRSLADEAGMGGVVHVKGPPELRAVDEAVRRHPEDALYLLLPSHLAPTAPRERAVGFLRKLRHLTEPVALFQGGHPTGALLVDREGLLPYLSEAELEAGERDRYLREHAARLPPVDDALGLADLRELAVTLEFLSGSFSARHFNHVSQDRWYVVKRSADRAKIRREHRFYGLLPDVLQPWFVQPFDFREDADGASYRMRRLFVPDLAVQWVHGALRPAQFDQLLDHLLHFLEVRPPRDVGREGAREAAEELYVRKVERRVEQLLAMEAGRAVDATLVAGGVPGGVRGLLDRYRAVYDGLARRRRERELVVTHGDLCFSNILYSPATQELAFIDPRGADTEDDLLSDRLYDVAKLSHSVLGGYDFIVAGLYDLVHGEDLAISLEVDDEGVASLRERFSHALEAAGFDVALVRACEASLFLSMLPLHIDAPKRVVAFALRAAQILDAIGGRR